MTPTVGRIVHFKQTAEAECQAAIVVRAWSPETLNLAVLRDGSNDHQQPDDGAEVVVWRTSVSEQSEHQLPENPTWHWPERIEE